MIGLRRVFSPAIVLCLGALVLGCGDDSGGDAAGSTGTAEGSTGMPATSMSTTTPMSTSTTASADSSSGGDDGPAMGECVLWNENECGDGRKCMPYSLEEDRIPDAIQCCDAVENPALDGEPCTAMEYNGSCLDNCAPGSMCVLDDEESLVGLCRRFCDPSANDCDPDQTCKAFFEMLLGVPNTPVCMDKCDPLVQDCTPQGWHCIPDTPTESGQSGFICSPPPPSSPKQLFQPCALANDCEAGLVCVTDDRIPDCSFAACCTAYCDVNEGDSVCSDLHPDMVCTNWMSPDPDWQDVGACTLPQQ